MMIGTWKTPANVDQFKSAVYNLHRTRNHSGDFVEECSWCIGLLEQGEMHGCGLLNHRMPPRYCHSGNPITNQEWEDWIKSYNRKYSNYVPKGSLPLTPFHLKDLRDCLVTSGD
jgi:hypothetical protein